MITAALCSTELHTIFTKPPARSRLLFCTVLLSITCSTRLKEKLMDTSQLISEINMEYARTMNKVIFDRMIACGASGSPAPLVQVGSCIRPFEPMACRLCAP